MKRLKQAFTQGHILLDLNASYNCRNLLES